MGCASDGRKGKEKKKVGSRYSRACYGFKKSWVDAAPKRRLNNITHYQNLRVPRYLHVGTPLAICCWA